MANKEFTIDVGAPFQGYTDNPYIGSPNEVVTNSNWSWWTHPGVLEAGVDIIQTQATLSSGANAGVLAAVRVSADSSNKIYGITGTTDSKNQIMHYSTSQGWVDVYKTTANGGWGSTPRGFVEYNSDAFIFLGSGTLIQVQDYEVGATPIETSKTISLATGLDMIVHQNCLYYAYEYLGANRAGKIGRFDATGSSLMTGAGAIDAYISLDVNYQPISMTSWNDYIVIGAGLSSDSTSRGGNAKLYVWDGVSQVFDQEVSINDDYMSQVFAHNGTVYVFTTSTGKVKVSTWSGGNSVTPLFTFDMDDSLSVPTIRKQAITSKDNFVFFSIFGATSSYVYGFGRKDATTPMQKVMLTTLEAGSITPVACYMLQYVGGIWLSSFSDNGTNKAFGVGGSALFGRTALLRTAPIFPNQHGRFKIKSVRVRHTDMTAFDTLTIAYNANQTSNPLTFTGTSLIAKSGTATAAGVGDAGTDEVRTYTYGHADDTEVPIMDGFQLLVKFVPGGSSSRRPRIIGPIAVTCEAIDSPL